MFSAIRRASVRNDDPNAALGNVKDAGKLVAIGEGPLRASPNRELAIGPLRHGRAGLKRSVRDVRNVVGRIETMLCSGEPFFHGTFLMPEPLI